MPSQQPEKSSTERSSGQRTPPPGTDRSSPIKFQLTPSVKGALDALPEHEDIPATDFVEAILDRARHREKYADGTFRQLEWQPTQAKYSRREWLSEILTLFDPEELIAASGSPRQDPELHGRLAIFGLALLEEPLRAQLEAAETFSWLQREIKPAPTDFLTERGHFLLRNRIEPSDRVPIWPDDPIDDPADDLLGRSYFAEYVANRIDNIPPTSGAYPIHLYAPWGAGKSSLLNMVKNKLEEKGGKPENRWKVVEFNAWRHQHLQEPWWQLMDLVYRETKKLLSRKDRRAERWWRFNTGRLPLILTIIVVIWILFVVSIFKDIDWLKGLGAIITLITTIGGGILAFTRSLIFGGNAAAESYVQLTQDPMNEIKRHFKDLIDRVPRRVAIFIDDLDRCQSDYVVRLLEGIQTLIRSAPVVIVIAADRRWLNACYEEIYEKLDHNVREPGKALGSLFLEKAFRATIPLPGISNTLQKEYWHYLLTQSPVTTDKATTLEEKEKLANAKSKAQDLLAGAKTDEQMQRVARNAGDLDFLEERALRGAIAVRMATPEVLQSIEHSLKPYAGLLDPNPRAMKRLVNIFSAYNVINLITKVDVDKHQLILWTVLCTHWPELSNWLLAIPNRLEYINNGEMEQIPEVLQETLRQPNLHQLLRGGPIPDSPLLEDTLRKCKEMLA